MKQQKKSTRKLSILTAVLILLFGVFIGGYLVLKSGKISAGELSEILNGKSVDLALCEPNANDPDKDSDQDGLKDWQEIQLYKTDACKQDSDGDGYLDGEEVASGYDPAKKAPGDELPGTTPKIPRPLPENLTEALRQKLAEQLSQNKINPLNEEGNLLSPSELEQYPGVQQAVWEITQHKDQIFAPEAIDEKELKISNDNSPRAIKDYAKQINEAFTRQFSIKPTNKETEAQLFLDFFEKNDPTQLNKMLQDYQNAYQKAKKVFIPSDFLTLHKKLLNAISSTIKIYQSILATESDPLKSTLALESFQTPFMQTFEWAQEFQSAVKTHINQN